MADFLGKRNMNSFKEIILVSSVDEPEPEPEEPDIFGSKEGARSGAKIEIRKEGAKSQSHFFQMWLPLRDKIFKFPKFH